MILRTALAGAALAFGLVMSASAAPLGDGNAPAADAPTPLDGLTVTPRLIEKPTWLRKPTGDDLARNYPDNAARRYISGQAMIQCAVTAAGTLTDCKVLQEKPLNMGFGAASLRLAPNFLMSPKTPTGTSIEGAVVTIPIHWQIY
jgi:protein TonB